MTNRQLNPQRMECRRALQRRMMKDEEVAHCAEVGGFMKENHSLSPKQFKFLSRCDFPTANEHKQFLVRLLKSVRE